ncbi:hypothetical protein EVA_07828 [gut metagenome]|uniref:Transmembrane protein n=1 Tax=gut metagenome TaxID=749906 RepID=J9GB61_9ZZZZ
MICLQVYYDTCLLAYKCTFLLAVYAVCLLIKYLQKRHFKYIYFIVNQSLINHQTNINQLFACMNKQSHFCIYTNEKYSLHMIHSICQFLSNIISPGLHFAVKIGTGFSNGPMPVFYSSFLFRQPDFLVPSLPGIHIISQCLRNDFFQKYILHQRDVFYLAK